MIVSLVPFCMKANGFDGCLLDFLNQFQFFIIGLIVVVFYLGMGAAVGGPPLTSSMAYGAWWFILLACPWLANRLHGYNQYLLDTLSLSVPKFQCFQLFIIIWTWRQLLGAFLTPLVVFGSDGTDIWPCMHAYVPFNRDLDAANYFGEKFWHFGACLACGDDA